jgi:transcriptional regulator with XRE-family HTH domain
MKKLFCSRLRELRGVRSQAEVARLLGMPQQNWQRYETGVTEPDLGTLHRICVTLGASVDWLIGLTEDRRGLPAGAAREAEDLRREKLCAECAAKAAVIADQARSLASLAETVREMSGVLEKNALTESSRRLRKVPV